MSIGIAFLGLQLACAICCFWLSGEKNRSAWWFFVGLIFGVIGLLTLVGAPVLEKEPKPRLCGSERPPVPSDLQSGMRREP